MSTFVIAVTPKSNFSKATKDIGELEFYSPQCTYEPPGISQTEDSLSEYQDHWTTGISPVKYKKLYAAILKYCDNFDYEDVDDLKFYICVPDGIDVVEFEDFKDEVKNLGKNAIVFINEFSYDESPGDLED